MQDVKLTYPLARFIPFAIFVSAATIVLLLALSVPFHVRFPLQILNRGLDCSSVSKKPTPFRQELNLGASALTVSFGWVRSPPRSHSSGSYVVTDLWPLSVLAVFLISSNAEDADVECFTTDASSNQVPIEMPGCKSHCALSLLSCVNVPFHQSIPRFIRFSTASWRRFPSSTLFLVRDSSF